MLKIIINSTTKEWVNSIGLPDDWTGGAGEWTLEDGEEVIDPPNGSSTGFLGCVWNGTSFNLPAEPAANTTLVWETDMAATDADMPRFFEDHITNRHAGQANNAYQQSKYDAKVTLRATKPV